MVIPPSGRVPEQDYRSPRLDFRGDGASVDVSWKITPSPKVLGQKAIYRRRGGARGRWGAPHDPQVWPRVSPCLAGVWGPPGPSPGLLQAISLFRVKNDLREFSTLFENISLRTFLKYKNSRKQKLALGILLIG